MIDNQAIDVINSINERLFSLEKIYGDGKAGASEQINGLIGEKLLKLERKIDKLSEQQSIHEVRTDKIKDLESAKAIAEESIITLEVKLGHYEEKLKDALYKYDRIIQNNLYIAGLLGDYGRFKNMKELIDVFCLASIYSPI